MPVGVLNGLSGGIDLGIPQERRTGPAWMDFRPEPAICLRRNWAPIIHSDDAADASLGGRSEYGAVLRDGDKL